MHIWTAFDVHVPALKRPVTPINALGSFRHPTPRLTSYFSADQCYIGDWRNMLLASTKSLYENYVKRSTIRT